MSQNNRVKLSKRIKKSKVQRFKVLRKEDEDRNVSVACEPKEGHQNLGFEHITLKI